jgi:phenylacetate-CoA ligase
MYNVINKNIIYPLYFQINHDDRNKYLRDFEVKQWESCDQIKRRQFDKFKKILKYAYDYCPFYKTLYSANGIEPEDIRNTDDIYKIPIVTKSDLQNNIQSIISKIKEPKDMYKDYSG